MAGETTIGTILINEALPEDMRREQHRLDKKGIHRLFMELAEKHPEQYAGVLRALSEVGKAAVWTEGLSVSLADLHRSEAKERILAPVRKRVRQLLDDDNLTDEQRKTAIVDQLVEVVGPLQDAVLEESRQRKSPFAIQVESGARGKKGSLASLKGADLLATDQRDEFIPIPLMHSYAEGLTPAEYFAASYGQRKGQLDVKLAVSDAGFLNKQLVNAAHRQVVTHDQPKPGRLPVGLPVETNDRANIGAVLAADIGALKAGHVLTDEDLQDLQDQGVDEILVASPMTEVSEDGGVSAWAAGRRTRQGLHLVGDNIGIPAAQAIGERLSQGALNCLPTGTLVRMADWSVKPIEQLTEYDTVMGADKRGFLAPARVKNLFDKGEQPVYRTVFRRGQKIETELLSTLNHKVLVQTSFTNHSEESLNGEPRVLPIGKKCRELRSLAPSGFTGTGSSDPRAYLMGLLLGDGCYTESVGGVFFSCADPELLDALVPYLRSLGLRWCHCHDYYYRLSQLEGDGIAGAPRDDKGRLVGGGVRNPARKLLQEYGIDHKYAHEKQIPADVFSWDNQSVAELVAGLIDTDGTVFRRTNCKALGVGFCSTSLAMVEQLSFLLSTRFGIYHSKIRELLPGKHSSRHAKRTLYSFHITDSESVSRFADSIPLKGVKRAKVARWRGNIKPRHARAGSAKRVLQGFVGHQQCWDIEVENDDHLFLLANGLIVSNSKHTAGVQTRISKAGFEYINRLIQAPQNFPEAGPLAEEDGRVDAVEEAPQGGHYIKVGERQYYAGPDLKVLVKPGQAIEQGSDLTDGTPHPKDLVRLRGMGEARRVYMRELREALKNSGVDVHRRNLESVVAGLLNWAQVTDPDGIGENIYDDVVPYGKLLASYRPRSNAAKLQPKHAVGRYLEEPVLHYTPGTRITKKIADHLQKWKVDNIFAHDEPPGFEPHMVRGMLSVYHDPDWRTRLGGFYTARAFERSLHRGLESDSKSTSFLAGIAQPARFGADLQRTGKYAQVAGRCVTCALEDAVAGQGRRLMMGPPGYDHPQHTAHFWVVGPGGEIIDRASDTIPEDYAYEGREVDPAAVARELIEALSSRQLPRSGTCDDER